MTDNNDMPRLVQVPIAGYIEVEIDPNIETEHSLGWDPKTPFEQAATDAASTALSDFFDKAKAAGIHLTEYEYMVDAYHAFGRGNANFVDAANEVVDLGVE